MPCYIAGLIRVKLQRCRSDALVSMITEPLNLKASPFELHYLAPAEPTGIAENLRCSGTAGGNGDSVRIGLPVGIGDV